MRRIYFEKTLEGAKYTDITKILDSLTPGETIEFLEIPAPKKRIPFLCLLGWHFWECRLSSDGEYRVRSCFSCRVNRAGWK